MKRYNFTLTELLVTIGIIIILAGLAIPAVLVAQQKGRVTAAKADMNAILTALKGVEGTYHKMVTLKEKKATFGKQSGSDNVKIDEDESDSKGYKFIRIDGEAYNYLIIELTNPKKMKSDELNINRRKITFLDPKSEYDPVKYDGGSDNLKNHIKANVDNLWRDPWGNPYVILINTNYTDAIPINGKYVSAKAIAYSFGPDGEDNSGQSTDYDDNDGDDICSWR